MTGERQDGEPLTPLEERAITLAGVALGRFLANDREGARRVVMRINSDCGGSGVTCALLAWCDAVIDKLPRREGGDTLATLTFMEVRTGRIELNAENVPPKVRWAGRMIVARAANDHVMLAALIDSLPDDGAEIGRHVWQLLEVTARNVKEYGAQLS